MKAGNGAPVAALPPAPISTLGLGVFVAELAADESAEFRQLLAKPAELLAKSTSGLASGANETGEDVVDTTEHGGRSRLA